MSRPVSLKTEYLTDWHCHLLPGIDDGPATMEESVEMASGLARAGFTTVHCTPHLIRGLYEDDNEMVRHGVVSLQRELCRNGIDIRLLAGREYYLDEFFADYLPDPLTLGESSYLLVEIPGHMLPEFIKDTMHQIIGSGFIPMIAHPERSSLFPLPESEPAGKGSFLSSLFSWTGSKSAPPQEEESLLDYLREIGCAFQGDLGSFAGLYGEKIRKNAEAMRRQNIYTHFGSDLHSPSSIDHIVARCEWLVEHSF